MVRLMVTRPPKLPALRTSSLDCFKAVWPANADRWMADVAMVYVMLSWWLSASSLCCE
jgi:hypothetical protein